MKIGDKVRTATGHEGIVKATSGLDGTCLVYLHLVHTWLTWTPMSHFTIIEG